MGTRKFSNSSINIAEKIIKLDGGITADVLVIAGGGGGGGQHGGGGGGAGGVVYLSNINLKKGTAYSCTVGAGGLASRVATPSGTYTVNNNRRGEPGNISKFGSFPPAIGGGGGDGEAAYNQATSGGSGGAGSGNGTTTGPDLAPMLGRAGIVGQGNAGGNGNGLYTASPNTYGSGGGGGGAGGAGSNATGTQNTNNSTGGTGGIGTSVYSSWGSATTSGQNVSGTYYFAGGGGGGSWSSNQGAGGYGGGGAGAVNASGTTSYATDGTANTGGGGGGSTATATERYGGHGGSGIIIVRVQDSITASSTTGSPATVATGGYRYYKFTGDGTITF